MAMNSAPANPPTATSAKTDCAFRVVTEMSAVMCWTPGGKSEGLPDASGVQVRGVVLRDEREAVEIGALAVDVADITAGAYAPYPWARPSFAPLVNQGVLNGQRLRDCAIVQVSEQIGEGAATRTVQVDVAVLFTATSGRRILIDAGADDHGLMPIDLAILTDDKAIDARLRFATLRRL